MARTGVVTDSTIDLPAGVRGHDVPVVPLVVNWDGQTYRDRVDISTAEFYQRLRESKSTPSTGAPSMGAFEEAFRKGLETHEGLVCVTIAEKLSATSDVARQAANAVDPNRIRVVESGSVTMPAGWLVERAAEMGAQGAAPDEIVQVLEEMRPRLRIYAILDTLEFLKRGGRIGRAQALAGTLLNIKPIILIKDGEVHPVERVRTVSGATRRLVEIANGLGAIEKLCVVHGDGAEDADELERQLEPHLHGLAIERGEISSVVGVHGGPGLFGIGVLLAASA